MTNIKKGDRVEITAGPIDKVGKVGIAATIAVNGAIVQFPDGSGTPVKFEHLRKVRAEVLKADGSRIVVEPNNGKSFTLEELRSIVGGTIDIQKLPKTGGKVVVNDNGELDGLPVNEAASALWRENYPIEEYPHNNDGTLVGDVLVCDGRMV